MTPRCAIDHITVTASTLEAGATHVHRALGIHPQTGGAHPRMGTHNLLLRLGDAMFLEVIAPDPQVAATRPRWFALDGLRPESSPALSVWVARTADIRATADASPEPLGAIEPMRRGALDWLITIPADGSLPLDGAAPALIEWWTGGHPAATLVDHGLSLVRLEIVHPEPARISRLLAAIGFEGPVAVTSPSTGRSPRLVAWIDTPQGVRSL